MDWTKQSEAMFKAWTDTQQKMWETFSESMAGFGKSPGEKMWAQAIKAGEELVKNSLDAQAAWMKSWSQNFKSLEGMPEQAASALEKALAADPQNAQNHLLLAKIYLRSGEQERAKAALRKAVASSEGELVAKLTLADVLLSEGSIEEAEALTKEILAQNPSQGDSILSFQTVLMRYRSMIEKNGQVDITMPLLTAMCVRAKKVDSNHLCAVFEKKAYLFNNVGSHFYKC